MKKLIGYTFFVALAALLTLPAAVLASDPDTGTTGSTFVVHNDDGEEVTVTIADGTITLVSREDGSTSTRIFDIEAARLLAADAVEEALDDMEDVFAELQDLQLDIRLGQDNRLNVSCEDSEFELDLDQVMAQVASAVQAGMQELDADEWADYRHHHESGTEAEMVSEDDLRAELSALKAEMKALRSEMKNLRDTEAD